MKDNEVYSMLIQLVNELEDDLQMDLEFGEHGYKSYEDSHNAIKKYTLTRLRAMVAKLKKRIEKNHES